MLHYFFFNTYSIRSLRLFCFMYSKELITKTIAYFNSKYSHVISEETAEVYLTAMAGLFESFAELRKLEDFSKMKV